MRAFFPQYSCAFRDRLPRVQFETCWDWIQPFVYTVHIASMILRAARFLCVLYAEISANATAELSKSIDHDCWETVGWHMDFAG